MIERVGFGAPNEAKFGFVQATRSGDELSIAGQVGKDNRTGEMLPAESIADHVANAMTNVGEAQDATVVAATVHVPAAVTIVGVPALSSPDYKVEISATAVTSPVQSVPYPDGPLAALGGAAAVRAGDRVYVAGHVGTDVAEAMAAVAETLARAGSSLDRILASHIYVVQGDGPLDFEAMCANHREAVGANPPAATLILVDRLPVDGAAVMITATAAIP